MEKVVRPGAEPSAPRILIVEDDPVLARMIERALQAPGREIAIARTGEDAVTELESGRVHAIAIDISLPDMSGLDVIATARERAPQAGIVAITGFVDVDTAVRSMKAGADDFLGKPFDPQILWHMLNKAAESRRRHIEAEQAGMYRQLAYTDALTGIPNRRFLDEFLDDAVVGAKRRNEPLTVAFVDVDNFKLLNDVVGHEEGDNVLQKVANLFEKYVRPPARFARFGGDEFVAVFPNQRPGDAREAMQHVCDGVRDLEVRNGARIVLPTRLSCGMAEYRGHGISRDLIAEAEDMMYVDKSAAHSTFRPVAEDFPVPEAVLKVANAKALHSLVKAIDRRDSYTRFHSDHATQVALKLAQAAGLDPDVVSGIAIGGPIHDLGKIVVPDEILRKPGPLTTEERRVMEEHPIVGAAITAAVTDYETVIDLVRHHHEWFDGAGYPAGLKHDAISLPTRVFAIADTFSAMTTDRPYRRALTVEHAVDEVIAGAGAQFDPDLVRLFEQLMMSQRGRAAA